MTPHTTASKLIVNKNNVSSTRSKQFIIVVNGQEKALMTEKAEEFL